VNSYALSGISTRSPGLARLGGDWLPDVIADANRPARSMLFCALTEDQLVTMIVAPIVQFCALSVPQDRAG